MECLFCKIAKGELGTSFVYEDERIVAFEDINPQAPHHLLIIPRQHIATVNDVKVIDRELVGHMVFTASTLAEERDIAEEGYRVIMNCNKAGGQEVYHIHLHLLGGRAMQWPPG